MSLLKNSTVVIVGVVISNLLAYVFHFIAGRMLGPEEYGEFGALMALFMVVALPAGALSSGITRFTSKFQQENKQSKIIILRRKIQDDLLKLSIFLLTIFILLSQWISEYLNINSRLPVIILALTLVFALLLPVNRGILQGLKKFRIYSWNSVLEAGFRLLLLIVLLFAGFGVNGAILAYGLAYLIAFLLIFPFIRKTQPANTDLNTLDLKPVYQYIILVLLVNLLMQSIINVPSLFIKHYYSSEFTGYWTAALNIARISMFVSGAISLVMFPEIAGATEEKIQKKLFAKAAAMVIVTSSCIALIFLFFPQFIIRMLFGSAYDAAAPVLEWLGFAMIFIGLLQLWVNYRLAKMKDL